MSNLLYRITGLLGILVLTGCGGGIGGTGTVIDPPGGGNNTPMVTLDGVASKGPFASGADVSYSLINDDGTLDDPVVAGQTSDLGAYSIEVPEAPLLLTVSGNYLSENTGSQSTSEIELMGVWDGVSTDAANVNLMTHLIHERVISLVGDGMAVTTAISNAESELTLALAQILPAPVSAIEAASLTVLNLQGDSVEGNAWLLTLSVILERYAIDLADVSDDTVEQELTNLLSVFAGELSDSGSLDLTDESTALVAASRAINPTEILENLLFADTRISQTLLANGDIEASAESHACGVFAGQIQCVEAVDGQSVLDVVPAAETVVLQIPLTDALPDINQFLDSDGDSVTNNLDEDDDNDGVPDNIDPLPFGASSSLVPPGSAEAFKAYIVSGLEQWGGLSDKSDSVETVVVANPLIPRRVDEATDGETAQTTPGADADFSDTNVLVQGVDELDAVKYDGSHFYLANWDRIQIIPVAEVGQAQPELAEINYEIDQAYTTRGLYLYNDQSNDTTATLVSLSQPAPVYWFDTWFAPWNWNESVSVELYDIEDPMAPTSRARFEFDGSYIDSRRIGNQLYVISRFTPHADDIIQFASSEEDQNHNRQVIEALEVADVLPVATLDGVDNGPLVEPENCFLPQVTDEAVHVYYPSITTITAINLDTLVMESLCMGEGVSGIHVSTEAIYVASAGHQLAIADDFHSSTTIHKFSFDESPARYVGTGLVPGAFWGDPKFLMGEHDGNLTVVTTDVSWQSESRFSHRLSVLGESSDPFRLDIIGQIPNKDRPEPIGKPNEQIFASRIMGDRAFIVTFLQIDPLYVIDLANPVDPNILGELEIPGFSTYLHPIAADLLLGFGRNIDDTIGQGLNLRLFDIADPTNPAVLSDLSIGRRGTSSDLEWDDHAFTILSDPESQTHRLAIPFSVYGQHQQSDPEKPVWESYLWSEDALYLFEVDESTRTLAQHGKVTAHDHATGRRYQPGCCAWNDRSVIQGEQVHYLHDNRLLTAAWTNPDSSENLFIPTLFNDPVDACTEEIRSPLWLSVSDTQTGAALTCPFITLSDGEFSTAEFNLCEQSVADLLGERAGAYQLDLSIPGYQNWTTNDVVVQRDFCHVGTTGIEVFMYPDD